MHEPTGVAAEEPVTATVVEAVAEETGCDPFELPPLYEAVDTDALNRLADRSRVGRGSNVTVTFAVAGCTVRVTGAGEVRVESGCERLDADPADPSAEATTDPSTEATTDPSTEATTDKSVATESPDADDSDAVEPSASNLTAE